MTWDLHCTWLGFLWPAGRPHFAEGMPSTCWEMRFKEIVSLSPPLFTPHSLMKWALLHVVKNWMLPDITPGKDEWFINKSLLKEVIPNEAQNWPNQDKGKVFRSWRWNDIPYCFHVPPPFPASAGQSYSPVLPIPFAQKATALRGWGKLCWE